MPEIWEQTNGRDPVCEPEGISVAELREKQIVLLLQGCDDFLDVLPNLMLFGREEGLGERRCRGRVLPKKCINLLVCLGNGSKERGDICRHGLGRGEPGWGFQFEEMAKPPGGIRQRLVGAINFREITGGARDVRMMPCREPMVIYLKLRGVEPRAANLLEEGEEIGHSRRRKFKPRSSPRMNSAQPRWGW